MNAPAQSLLESTAGGRERKRLRITGTVQGVGFRPFLYRRAVAHGLSGFALNGTDGVVAEVEGSAEAIAAFIDDIRESPPVNAVIRDLAISDRPVVEETGFRIRESARDGAATTSVLPDLATCDDCFAEIFDPLDRRYLYPFTNCTNCGPRYSIIHDLPYDRARTVMHDFPMCSACAAEYADPDNRRFHAEPNACPDCGPQLALLDSAGRQMAVRHAALLAAADAISRGDIVAVKGLGGFHLMADARDSETIRRLRQRKHREEKPFAIMVPSLMAARALCHIDDMEERLLTGRERPIVLLRRRPDATIASEVAPENPYLGLMLPYTPLHHILMAELDFPVVATSGNLSDEPIATDNDDALVRLGETADLFLVHDREIVRPVDDSVARALLGRPQILRRARGYAPASIAVASMSTGILALGGHLKAAVALTQDDGVVMSPHIGDLNSASSRDAFETVIDSLLRLYERKPRALACDLHPDYHTTHLAEAWAAKYGLPLARVPHHLAHVAAGMAEHGLNPPVLGVAWDGTGFGTDGTIWGGEFLLVTEDGWKRIGHLRPFRLPGGEAAIREPRRAAFGLLYEMFGADVSMMGHLPPIASFSESERRTLVAMLGKGINAPVTTSAGRLFDGVAALLGLRQTNGYEGQAACALEWEIDGEDGKAYDFAVTMSQSLWIVDWAPALHALLDDLKVGVPVDRIAAGFHAGLAKSIAEFAGKVGVETVMLTGGCFQNRQLTERTAEALERAGHRPNGHENVPPGDGGLALGQAYWAALMIERGELPCV
jgi:hydrogenase maturation protein HypF